ncbi:unnamed protein product [Orchesella dallaii]|uniref:Uncharacterized protein n=1 Tax=Orchesella dallaii TaxID=48710 RepID=A0ABP1RH10_9HEXA
MTYFENNIDYMKDCSKEKVKLMFENLRVGVDFSVGVGAQCEFEKGVGGHESAMRSVKKDKKRERSLKREEKKPMGNKVAEEDKRHSGQLNGEVASQAQGEEAT